MFITVVPVCTKLTLESFTKNAEQYADGTWEARHINKLKMFGSASEAIRFVEHGAVIK